MSNPFDDAVFELLTGKSTSAPPQPVDGNQLLHDISSFIGRYLYCSEHQRTILALWVLHTYCYSAAQVTPYLAIQSAEKQSGKTLCLQLLQMLCNAPVLTAGFTASSLLRAMKSIGTNTLLLDECQASIGTRSRPKAPTLRAILIRGTHQDPDTASALRDRRTFCPKAFAGRGQLPEDLADHSIPIILQPLAHPITEPVLEVSLRSRRNPPMIEHLHIRYAVEEAKPLRRQLCDWYTLHRAALHEISPCTDDQFPPELSYRQQDLCEPLLHLAELIGGDWPTRIRQAFSAAFAEQASFDLRANIQLLADIRDCFAYYGDPKRLSTSNIRDWVHSLPARPWDMDGDGRFSAHTLARLLAPFEIRPRMQRMDIGKANANGKDKAEDKRKGKNKDKDNSGLRGYQLADFQEPWQKHLDVNAPQSEIANVDAGCCGVALAQATVVPSPVFVAATENHTEVNTDRPPASELTQSTPSTLSTPSTSSSVTHELKSEITGHHSEIADNGSPVPPDMSSIYLRLTSLQESLRLQGRYNVECLARQFSLEDLKARLYWAESHGDWSLSLCGKHCLDFVNAFFDINPRS